MLRVAYMSQNMFGSMIYVVLEMNCDMCVMKCYV